MKDMRAIWFGAIGAAVGSSVGFFVAKNLLLLDLWERAALVGLGGGIGVLVGHVLVRRSFSG